MTISDWRSDTPPGLECLTGAQEFSVAAGEVIFDRTHAPIGLYLVRQGLVQTGIKGSSRVVQLVRQNEVMGFGSLREKSEEWAIAVCETQMTTFEKSEVTRLITERATFRGFVLDQLIARLARTEIHLNRCRSEAITERVGHTLLDLAEPMSFAPQAAHRLTAIPHRILASYLGTSREMITVALNRFKRLGLVQYTRREMFVNALPLRRYLAQPRGLDELSESAGEPGPQPVKAKSRTKSLPPST